MVVAVTVATAAWAQQTSSGSSRATSADSAFAMKAAQANMAEIELGKLAQQKAASQEVKKFGQQMIDDHGKSLDELKGIAMKKSMSLPAEIDAKHKALEDRLAKMNGAEFDRAYIQAMVDGHKEVAAEFRKESQSGADSELKAYAAKTLPTIEEHLRHAEMLNRDRASSKR
jgi:putative membrane protein